MPPPAREVATPVVDEAQATRVRHRDRVIAALSHEVETRLRTIGRDGGLILGPTHHVQLDTPMENFWAMVETIRGRTFPAASSGPGQ